MLFQRSLLALALLAVSARGQLSDSETRGRQLYDQGIGADGQAVSAVGGEANLALPAAFVACVNCHGYDGRGKAEAGSLSPDIRWETLTKPYSITSPTGRRRLPYDASTFFKAITQGLDSTGQPLDATMPRYRISPAEAANVLAYVKQIGRTPGEGVTDDTLRIGFLLPIESTLIETAGLDQKILAACLEDVNRAGGIYRRRIELTAFNASSPGQLTAQAMLAVLDSSPAGADPELAQTCEQRKIPVVSLFSEASGQVHRYGFSLFPGVAERARALVRYAIKHGGGSTQPRVVLIYSEKDAASPEIKFIVAAVKPLIALEETAIAAGKADDAVLALRDTGTEIVLLQGTEADLAAFSASAQRHAWEPLQLWLEPPARAVQTSRRAFTLSTNFSSAVSPAEPTAGRQWASRHGLSMRDLPRQCMLIALAETLTEGLKTAGREVSREKLAQGLEALCDFKAGLTSPLNFTSRRHTATSSVYVVPCQFTPGKFTGEWVPID